MIFIYLLYQAKCPVRLCERPLFSLTRVKTSTVSTQALDCCLHMAFPRLSSSIAVSLLTPQGTAKGAVLISELAAP